MSDSGSKTEKATPKKRQDQRKKGNVFTSKDIISVVSMLVLFIVIKMMLPFVYGQITLLTEKYMNYAGIVDTITLGFSLEVLVDCIVAFFSLTAPIMLISILVSVVVSGVQTKFIFSMEGLRPKFSRMNPLEGLKKMVSLKSFVEVIKGLLKITIIGYIIYDFFVKRIYDFSQTMFMGLEQSIAYVLGSTMNMIYSICMIFIFIAGLDYLYQKWDYEKQLKMSKHEVKEEYKQMEGDPKIKGKIKEQQRKMAMSRMMQSVPSADVVIKNPTHFAVALRYNIEKDNAPVVVAKGQDEIALRIISVAEKNNIYVMENRELARAIYSASEINAEIPLAYYSAVAEILAMIFSMRK